MSKTIADVKTGVFEHGEEATGNLIVGPNHYVKEKPYSAIYMEIEDDYGATSIGIGPDTARAVAAKLIEYAEVVEANVPKEQTVGEYLEAARSGTLLKEKTDGGFGGFILKDTSEYKFWVVNGGVITLKDDNALFDMPLSAYEVLGGGPKK